MKPPARPVIGVNGFPLLHKKVPVHSDPMPRILRRFVLRRSSRRPRPPLWVELSLSGRPDSAANPGVLHGSRADESGLSTPDRDMPQEQARLYSLVLQARYIPCRMRRRKEGWSVQVRRMDRERALEELGLWLAENARQRTPAPPPPPLPGTDQILPPALYGLALVAAYAFGERAHPALHVYPRLLLERGSADAAAIWNGEWWRAATALTLHGDGPHVLGNAVVSTLFVSLVCVRLGCGPALLLTVLGGVLGNLCNALVMGPPHDSIGFSTAVFAAAGLLATQGLADRSRWWRPLVPLGAGFGLLAMLGAGGENTDLGAHLFGFGAGLLLGAAAWELTRRYGRPGKTMSWMAGVASAALPLGAWVMAWGFG